MTKQCSTCKLFKPLSEFHKNHQNSDGMAGQCKDCKKACAYCIPRTCQYCGSCFNTTLQEAKKGDGIFCSKSCASKSAYQVKAVGTEEDKKRAHETVKYILETNPSTRPDVCSECGISGDVVAHHNDYRLPKVITWLCQKCHIHHHRGMKLQKAEEVFLG